VEAVMGGGDNSECGGQQINVDHNNDYPSSNDDNGSNNNKDGNNDNETTKTASVALERVAQG
jgi:hypothetical protein